MVNSRNRQLQAIGELVVANELPVLVACDKGPDIGSDHWPLLTRFRVAEQSPPPKR